MDFQPIVETLTHADWTVQDWHIRFLFSERQLNEIKKASGLPDWYENPQVAATWITLLHKCFGSIHRYNQTFGDLPQIGDRLFDEDTGLLITERSFDGGLMTVTYTLSC